MVDSSPSDVSSIEYDGYDPIRDKLLDDSINAYQPHFVSSENKEDSVSVDLSDDEFTPVYDPKQFASSPISPELHDFSEHDVPVKREQDALQSHPNRSGSAGYISERLIDTTTPIYTPSRTVDSDFSACSSNGSDVVTQKKIKRDSSGDAYIEKHNTESLLLQNSDEEDLEQQQGNEAELVDNYPRRSDLMGDNEDDEDANKFIDEFEGFERDDQPESQVDGIIADIFGESDAEEEFEGFAENELDKGIDDEEEEVEHQVDNGESTEKQPKSVSHVDDENDVESGDGEEFVSDFDRIMEQRREESRRKRRRNKDIEFLNDNDDLIVETISRMKVAADEDRQLLSAGQPATKKLAMFKEVVTLLKRADLKSALIDNGMLSAITEWLSPLPGHTLPNLIIRDSMLICLNEFQSLSPEVLQESGIGKALMYLYRHPRETKDNKDRAERLINQWLRPIFNLTSDYRTLTKEERKQLDYEHLPKRRNIGNGSNNHRDINRELDGESKCMLRPGDPGWVGRARVPQPSNKDYIIRPKWNVTNASLDGDDDDNNRDDDSRNVFRRRRKPNPSGYGTSSRIESHIRNLTSTARRSLAKTARAVPMSIEGRKMTL